MEILKNQHNSFINIDHAICKVLEKDFPEQFKPVQQIGNHGFGNHIAHEIVDELFHTFDHTNTTDISKINDSTKTP